MFKKSLLASAIALTAFPALAVDLDADTGSVTFASEISTATATTLTNDTNALDVIVDAGFSISDGTARYMRFDLNSGAVFSAVPTLAVDDSNAGAATVLSTGGTGESFVVFEVTASTGQTVAVANDATLASATYNVTGQSAVTMSYSLYADPTDAVNASGSTLATESGTLLSFTPATAVTASAGTSEQIDVTKASSTFTNSTNTTDIGNLVVTLTTANVENALGATDVNLAAATTAANLVLTGDFSALQTVTGGVETGNYALTAAFIDNDGACNSADVNATALTATTATFALNTAQALTAAEVCVTVNGTTVIAEQTFTASYEPTAAAGYTIADVSFTMNTLSKNGSTKDLELLLTPSGAFSNYVRITNPSTIDGDVFVTLINDAGDSVQFDLSDVDGQSTNNLVKGGSTTLIKIEDLYAAAQAKDSSFDVNGGKLRADIEGEFSGIEAQSITLSTDNTTFSTF